MQHVISVLRQIDFLAFFTTVLTVVAISAPAVGDEKPAGPERIALWNGQSATRPGAIPLRRPGYGQGAAVALWPGRARTTPRGPFGGQLPRGRVKLRHRGRGPARLRHRFALEHRARPRGFAP